MGNCYKVSKTTLEKLRELQAQPHGLRFILVTTRRYTTSQAALEVIPHSCAILDYGSLVFINGQLDREWLEILRPYIGNPLVAREKEGVLWTYEQRLRAEIGLRGFEVYSDGRFGFFRVAPFAGIGIQSHTQFAMQQDIEMLVNAKRPEEISAVVVRNRFVDFFPSIAGNANAANRILQRLGVTKAEFVAYAGINAYDAPALRQFYPLTLAESDIGITEAVKARGGHISPYTRHMATFDILTHIAGLETEKSLKAKNNS